MRPAVHPSVPSDLICDLYSRSCRTEDTKTGEMSAEGVKKFQKGLMSSVKRRFGVSWIPTRNPASAPCVLTSAGGGFESNQLFLLTNFAVCGTIKMYKNTQRRLKREPVFSTFLTPNRKRGTFDRNHYMEVRPV